MSRNLRLVLLGVLCGGVGAANGGLIQPVSITGHESPINESFDWKAAAEQSFFFLTFQHAFRLTQEKTVRELRGPFFKDYGRSVKGLNGWEDGDGAFTNYVAHPMMGAASGYIQIQNDPRGANREFSKRPEYWRSRLKATGFAAVYSTQFELGLYSEATIGNVGLRPGTMGYVDFVMTPVGGFGWMVGEDAIDRFLVLPLERRWDSRGLTRFLRMALSPTRSFANVLRKEKPWKRDSRR